MGCGNEISDWDDKAVQDSLAGKNTELTPELKAEAEECRAAREFLQEKTRGFEKSNVVHNRDMVRAISHVPLAREIAQELGIHSITFEGGLRQLGLSALDKDGAKIFIGPNAYKEECQRTLLHEVGELYYKEVLVRENPEIEKKWIEMRKEAKFLSEREIQDDQDKKNDGFKAQHHFAERFADYGMAHLGKDPVAKEETMDAFKHDFPNETKAFNELFDKLINK